MNNHKKTENSDDDIFDMSIDSSKKDNCRIAVRYIREDITAVLIYSEFLRPSKRVLVKLLDISSKGALIEFKNKLSNNKKMILELTFNDSRKFRIKSTIIHHVIKSQYGLIFDSLNNELGNYLFKSQKDLKFK